ncbi:MAG: hypothetical protein P4M11_02100 [Candidatus Pacebacteria bacterium]|nr:hypothetical protein [Candidatus Paceibacterota bacterium]
MLETSGTAISYSFIKNFVDTYTTNVVDDAMANMNRFLLQDRQQLSSKHQTFLYTSFISIDMFPNETFNLIDCINMVQFVLLNSNSTTACI